MRSARILKWIAFVLTMLLGALGGMFVAAYAFQEPGGWAAVGLTAAWLVPLVLLAVLALLRPQVAGVVLAVAVGLVVVIDAVGWSLGEQLRALGPFPAVAALVVGVALGFLGLRRPRLAGLLLAALAVLQYAMTVLGALIRSRGEPGGPGPMMVLGGSSGAVVMPLLVLGVLFFIAGTSAHEKLGLRRAPA